MNYQQYDTDHLHSMRYWLIHTIKTTTTPEMSLYAHNELHKLGLEISKRLQLTLDFDQESEDGAYAD